MNPQQSPEFGDLIEQPSLDRMDVIEYASFTPDGTLNEVVSEKEYMATDGQLNLIAEALLTVIRGTGITTEEAARNLALHPAPGSFDESLTRLQLSVGTFRSALADELHSYFQSIE